MKYTQDRKMEHDCNILSSPLVYLDHLHETTSFSCNCAFARFWVQSVPPVSLGSQCVRVFYGTVLLHGNCISLRNACTRVNRNCQNLFRLPSLPYKKKKVRLFVPKPVEVAEYKFVVLKDESLCPEELCWSGEMAIIIRLFGSYLLIS